MHPIVQSWARDRMDPVRKDILRTGAVLLLFYSISLKETIGNKERRGMHLAHMEEVVEYVRLDKKYRYVSEQVSHHPPVSACWAESPHWHYFGEVVTSLTF